MVSRILLLIFLSISIISPAIAQTVNIPDAALRAAVETELGKNAGDTITEAEMRADTFTFFFGDDKGISDLTGLEYATNLEIIFLQGNSISDITPVSTLTRLTNLYLTNNEISDISPLSNISAIHTLLLGYNEITSLEDLPNLGSAEVLQFQYNQVTSIKPLIDHTEYVGNDDRYVNVSGNPLDDDSINNHIPTLIFNRYIGVVFHTKFVKKISGDSQTVHTDTEMQPFVVEVSDADGNTLSGVNVEFQLFSGIGYFSDSTYAEAYAIFHTTTDDDGRASATLMTGSGTGTYRVSVRVSDARSQTFTATVTEAPLQQTQQNQQNPPTDRVADQQSAEPNQQQPEQTTQPTVPVEEQEGAEPNQQQSEQTTRRNSGIVTAPPQGITAERTPTVVSKVSTVGQIGFSELMIPSRGGFHSLSQWIELYNSSDAEAVNLKDWKLEIEVRDANGVHRHAVMRLEALHIPPKETGLIVTWVGRNSVNLPKERIYNFFNHHSDALEQNAHRNMVIGHVGFSLKLSNPEGTVIDVAGNLDGDSETEDEPLWELPSMTTEDGHRTSLMRRYEKGTGVPLEGSISENWVPASALGELLTLTYWGRDTDIGNPGYRGAGTLPVTLSHFRAEKTDVGVILEWTTESELDNAGFNILRSQSKRGPFVKVNPTLITGAGTTSERTAYAWQDTKAQPNVAYYYQIEDVSFSGNRQRLATVRMRGDVTANGKFTTIWGGLKSQE